MIRRTAMSVLAIGLLGVTSAAAQTVVRQPAAPLDSARAALRSDLIVLRDSLITIDGAASRLQRDYRTASDESLLSRARVMRDACARSSRTVPPIRAAILEFSLADSQRVQRRRAVVAALDSLAASLRWCEKEFAAMSKPGQAKTIRGYANDRAVKVQSSLRHYERQLQPFLASMGMRILPRAANSNAASR